MTISETLTKLLLASAFSAILCGGCTGALNEEMGTPVNSGPPVERPDASDPGPGADAMMPMAWPNPGDGDGDGDGDVPDTGMQPGDGDGGGPNLGGDSGIPDSGTDAGIPDAGGEPDAGGGPDAGGDSGTADSGTPVGAYNPCPATGTCRIAPTGDSITVGVGSSNGGYRIHVSRQAIQDDKDITFVGNDNIGPTMVDGEPISNACSCYPSFKVSDLANKIPSPALDDNPHIVLLMIGTNNMRTNNPGVAPRQLEDEVLDVIVSTHPDALIVLAKIIPIFAYLPEVEAYNASLEQIVAKRAARGEHIVLVDMFTGFTQSMLDNQLHPNEVGYEWMAERWWQAIKDLPADR